MSVFQLDNGRWRVQIRRRGFPSFDKVFPTKKAALAAEAEVLAQQYARPQADGMTVAEAWLKYEASYEFSAKATNTQRTERGRIKPVLEALGDYSLAHLEASPSRIYDYIDARSRVISTRTKRRLSGTNIRLEVAALSAVVAWAKQRRIVSGNFVRHIDRPKTVKRKRRVPAVEQAKLESTSLAFDQPLLAESARFFLLLRLLGARPGELAGLLRTDAYLESSEVMFRRTKTKKEDRKVHTTPKARNLLDTQLRYAHENAVGSPFLFSTLGFSTDRSRRQWKQYDFSYAVKRLRQHGVLPEDFHPHAMRREFISRAIESGMPYATIRKQTGHHSTQAIEIYDEGLSTAPEIRAALDKHEQTVNYEQLLAMMANLGLPEEAIEKFKAELSGEMPKPAGRIWATQSKKKPSA